MNELAILIILGLIIICGFYLHTLEQHYEKNLPVSVKYPKYTNYDLAKEKYMHLHS